jgi:nitric oxide reductase NorQ protein
MTTGPITAAAQDPQPAPTAGEALRSGQLYVQVATFLADNPDQAFKVGDITRALGARSSGAVHEAGLRMASAGYATHTTKPHRFQITADGIAAAGTLPPPVPRRSNSGSLGTKAQPVERPNGQLYHPRRLARGTDITVLRDLRAANIPVLLYGPPGTGKTALVEAAFPDLYTIAGTGDTIVDDFIGSYFPNPDGTFSFVHGPLVNALRDGRPLLVDDATLISPKVLAVLYPLMDGRNFITLTSHRNEQIQAAPGFYIVGGHNPGVHGAVLTDALSSRFKVQIEVTTDMDVAKSLGVPGKVIAAATLLNAQLADGTVGWAPQQRELSAFAAIAGVLGTDAAVANLIGVAPDEDRDDVIAALRHHFSDRITALRLGKQR